MLLAANGSVTVPVADTVRSVTTLPSAKTFTVSPIRCINPLNVVTGVVMDHWPAVATTGVSLGSFGTVRLIGFWMSA